jgi:hypothetical protein
VIHKLATEILGGELRIAKRVRLREVDMVGILVACRDFNADNQTRKVSGMITSDVEFD